ncbi:helix-turn-helix domain-containing protein [Lutibacter holmesii]|uniref:Helix-turn-helix domain-containing protein n=1 Tax=Lutibacter holmesii TaxID=1137985 RepID=A0ABW3WMQ8_9FLAO
MLDQEITKINTPLYDNFPLSWHLFRSRADNYAKNSELLILSNEVKDQFNKEVTPKLRKEYSYEQFIKGITIWETLLYVTDTFKENSDLIEMMFKLNQFKGFKLVPYTNDTRLLKLYNQYSEKLKESSLKTDPCKPINTFDIIKNKKLEIQSRGKIKQEDPVDYTSLNIEELIETLTESVLQNIEQSLPHTTDDGFLSTKQLSEFLQLKEQTIYGLVNQDKIPYEKRGQKLYFIKEEIVEWVKSGRKIKDTGDEKIENFFTSKLKYNKK